MMAINSASEFGPIAGLTQQLPSVVFFAFHQQISSDVLAQQP